MCFLLCKCSLYFLMASPFVFQLTPPSHASHCFLVVSPFCVSIDPFLHSHSLCFLVPIPGSRISATVNIGWSCWNNLCSHWRVMWREGSAKSNYSCIKSRSPTTSSPHSTATLMLLSQCQTLQCPHTARPTDCHHRPEHKLNESTCVYVWHLLILQVKNYNHTVLNQNKLSC